MEYICSLPCSKQPTSLPVPKPDICKTHLHKSLFKNYFNIIHSSRMEHTYFLHYLWVTFQCVSKISHICQMSLTFHIHWFVHPSIIQRAVGITWLFILISPQFSYHHLFLRFRYCYKDMKYFITLHQFEFCV